jgi:hypothetical protein
MPRFPFPSHARLTGPGISSIEIGGSKAARRSVAKLAGYTGFFAAVMPTDQRPLLPSRPEGELGSKYEIRYRIPRWTWRRAYVRSFSITQDVYPYAVCGPVTHVALGQRLFNFRTRGGWFRANSLLEQTLVQRGLPTSASTISRSRWSEAFLIGAPVVFLLFAGVGLFTSRRRA